MNESTIRALLTAVRQACPPSIWSEAVELARGQGVVGEKASDEEIRIRVSTDGGLVSPTVVFWPQDEDWFCDCSSRGDACVHVAAAIIALRRAQQSGQKLPGQDRSTGRLSYRFSRTASGLSFERYLVAGEQAHRLDTTLSSVASGRVSGPRFVADQVDLQVERALGAKLWGVFPMAVMGRLLEALVGHGDVRLDGEPVQVQGPSAPIHGRLEDCGEGFRLLVEQDPSITEIFSNGVVLCGKVLRPIGECALSARELEELRSGRIYPFEEVAALVTDVLPQLQERIPVRVLSQKLPPVVSDVRPRLLLETRRDQDLLSVLPLLVYGEPPIARVDGDRLTHLQGPVPMRYRESEQRLLQRLENALGLSVGRRYQCTGQDAVAWVNRLQNESHPFWKVEGEGHKSFYLSAPLEPRLAVHDRSFDLFFESSEGADGKGGKGSSGGKGQADPNAVLEAWSRGEALVPLLDGGWAPLPQDWLKRFGPILCDLMAAKEAAADKQLPTCALPDLARLCDELQQPRPQSFERLRGLMQDFSGLPQVAAPADLTATLRDYQRKGVAWLSFMRQAGLGAMLADDMGLGKTLQALCVLHGRSLVVAPTSVLHNWAEEIQRFRPGLKHALYYGPNRQLDEQAHVVLTTYAILRLDADQLATQHWDTVVLDEAQTIKNPDSQVARASYQLKADFRLTLSGTPVENRLDELWSQFHFLNRGLLGGRHDFQERYAKPVVEGQPGAALRLRERIRPFVLRRLKQEVAPELPPRTEVVLRCELSDSERELYQSLWAATLPQVIERLQSGGSVLAALEALLRLRQACCHPALVPGQQADSSSKVELLLEQLQESIEAGHKALVFSQWTSLLDLLEPHLTAAGIPFCRLDGSTRDRQEVVRLFQSDDGPPVMLISLKAGGTGLNLTAADHIYLMDLWWNPAVEDQAADRAHRIGQDRPVLVHRLVCTNTVEERILQLQEQKRGIMEAALGGSQQAASLTREDLLAILS